MWILYVQFTSRQISNQERISVQNCWGHKFELQVKYYIETFPPT